MRKKTIYCYLDGKIIPVSKAFVSVYDIGLLRGYAIYDGITAFNEKIFHLADHLTRFRNSAKALKLKIPVTDTEIRNIINTLIRKNGFDRTNIRLILTGGQTLEGIDYDFSKPLFYILAEDFVPFPDSIYTKGGKLITEEHQRFMPEAKTTHYITAVKLQTKKNKEKAVEILFVSNGKILECATSNIFIVKGDTLITSKQNVLGGITRKVVLKITKKYFKIEERDISTSELAKCDEVFITSSYKDILPIVKIDKHTIGDGKVGKNTKKIMDLFGQYIKAHQFA